MGEKGLCASCRRWVPWWGLAPLGDIRVPTHRGEVAGWAPYRGFHTYDTAVVCQGFARLVGGDTCAGRLQVRRGQVWTSVCEDHVDIKAAQVVCRELGCGTVLAVRGTGRFEAGTGPLWEQGFECTGTESLLATCTQRPPRSQGCTSHASIICSRYTGFRLAENSSSCAGRVEVEAGGTWGSLCATSWDLSDAERHPGECPMAVLGEPACPPGHAAAVNCSVLVPWPHGITGDFAGIAEPLRLVEGESRCDGQLEVTTSAGAWARVPVGLWDAQGASVVCRQLGCGVPEKVYTVPGLGTAGLQGLQCAGTEENVAQCNVSGTATTPTGSPEEGALVCVPSSAAPVAVAGTVPVPTVLCVVLGTLLCLALGALAVQVCRARAQRRGPGRAADAVSDAVYEELDYTLMPDYQEVPSRPGSLSEGSGTKLPYYTGDSMEESDFKAAPDSSAQHGPPDGYDDAAAVPQESPAPSTGDLSEGVARRSEGCVPPAGGSHPLPSPPGATRDPPAQPPGDTDYDDIGISTLGTSL
ncbi:PREDICTED: antigen WC1.1-like [Nipponia nippon]|uniref:antigen WC1.1-like n=1 Tax=Nipponia nippon TaxID=128390 RepID=UPI000510C8F9|nr:PREDICTED: antigen WC1.1-like [Nipponia nippon]